MNSTYCLCCPKISTANSELDNIRRINNCLSNRFIKKVERYNGRNVPAALVKNDVSHICLPCRPCSKFNCNALRQEEERLFNLTYTACVMAEEGKLSVAAYHEIYNLLRGHKPMICRTLEKCFAIGQKKLKEEN